MLALELVGGLVLLVAGGEALLRGAVDLANRMRVSPLLIGLTLVGFGTSTPELVTSLEAAFRGSPGIAVGNVVGSNTANILLILGLAAVLAPVAVHRAAFLRDGTTCALAALACLAVVLTGHLDRLTGFLLVAGLVGYIGFSYAQESRRARASEQVFEAAKLSPLLAIGLVVGGLALTIFGARLLVDGAIELARWGGISETVIGLTIVAIGTSLPELVTTVMAAARRQADIAFGNVIGSNIYNVLGIMGVTALVHPIDVPAEIVRYDIWVMLAATAAMGIVAWTGSRITRPEGAVMLGAYGVYLYTLVPTS